MFEEADARLDQALSQQSEEQKPQDSNPQEQETKQPELTDLEKLERFTYQGREMTPKDLQSAMMMQADYTRKTQEIAQERKYYDALADDLKSVRENPALAQEFRKIYPEKFHGYLEYALNGATQQQQQPGQQLQQQTQVQPQVPKEFMDRFQKLESAWSQQEVEKAQAQLDSIFDKYSKKFDMADERTVLATAQQLHGAGTKLDEATWEKIFKADHDRHMERFQAYYKTKQTNQLEANRKARDAGPGGGTPGQAPVKRTFDEATKAAIQELGGRPL